MESSGAGWSLPGYKVVGNVLCGLAVSPVGWGCPHCLLPAWGQGGSWRPKVWVALFAALWHLACSGR